MSLGILDILKSVASPQIKLIKMIDLIVGSTISAIMPTAKKATCNIQSIQKILIIRPGGIGDAIFLLPILRQLKIEYPQLRIDILCEKRNQDVFKSQAPLAQSIYCYDQIPSFMNVFHNQYDAIIDTEQWHYLSALTVYFLKSSISIGFSTRPLRAKLFSLPVDYDPNGYELNNFKKLFQIFEFKTQPVTVADSFAIDATTQQWAAEEIKENTLAIFLGASIPLRRISNEQLIEIIRNIGGKFSQIILLGGQDIVDESRQLKAQFSSDSKIKNYIGEISLLQTAGIIQKCKLFIGPDSGIMHLACAVGTPVVAIFGPGNLQKWGPKGALDKVISKHVPCSPCTHFGYTVPTCGGEYFCMLNKKDSLL